VRVTQAGTRPPRTRAESIASEAPHKRPTRYDTPLDDDDFTAQPVGLPEELAVHLRTDEGLSIEPEEMGRQFLGDAVEQGDFEPVPDANDDELNPDSAPRSDAAITGPNIEAEDDVWENTVNETLEAGGSDRALDELAPAAASVERERDELEDAAEQREAFDEMDLSSPNEREASLFDHEGDELGEVESPELNTEDAHHSRRRP